MSGLHSKANAMCKDDWSIEWPSLNMTAIGGKDIGGSEADFTALHSMVDGRVEGMI